MEEDNDYNFLLDEEDLASQLGPQLIITTHRGTKCIATYLLEIFDTNVPRYRIKKRLQQYYTYLCEVDWTEERPSEPFPIILLVCPRLTDLIYAKRRTRGVLTYAWYEDAERIHIAFTTTDKLRTSGALSKIWEDAHVPA